MLRLFHVLPSAPTNPKIQSLLFADLPILSAKFSPDGRYVILVGRRKHFYIFDLKSSNIEKVPYIRGLDTKSLELMHVTPNQVVFILKDGHIHFLDIESRQWITSVKVCILFCYYSDFIL